MSEATLYDTRNNLSSVIDDLLSGKSKEHVIKRRETPVARIVPIEPAVDASKRIGAFRDAPAMLDDDLFDAMDAQVAELFGA
ncbi:MAG: hypothetical protein IJ131_03385 [Eggerthellaceae bacterium]|nr:hypothetical protein [Eggerthellaceae bacterium]